MGNITRCYEEQPSILSSLRTNRSSQNMFRSQNQKLKKQLYLKFERLFQKKFNKDQNGEHYDFYYEFFYGKINCLISEFNIDIVIRRVDQIHYADTNNQPNIQVKNLIIYSLQRNSIENYDLNDQLYLQLKYILGSRQNLFQSIIIEYHKFLEKIFQLQQVTSKSTIETNEINTGISKSTKHNFQTQTKLKPGAIKEKIKKMKKEELETLIKSYLIIYQLLHYYVELYIKYVIGYQYPNNIGIGEQMQKDQTIGNAVEYFLLSKNSILNNLMKPLLLKCYQPKNSDIPQIFKSNTNSYESNEKNIALEYYINQPIMSDLPSFKFNQKRHLIFSLQQDYQPIQEEIKEEIKEDNQSPTFDLLLKLINESRFWMKFQLIMDFNNLVSDLHCQLKLRNRQRNSIDSQNDSLVLSQEDKENIYSFIITKFIEYYNREKLREFFSELKFMHQQDEVIKQDYKNRYVQSFITFYGIMGMLLRIE